MRTQRYEVDGRRVKLARVALGMTQRQLAQIVGVSQELVSAWELGARRLTAEHLQLLVDTLQRVGPAAAKKRTRPAAGRAS